MMADILEKPTVNPGNGNGPAVLDRPVVDKKKSENPAKERKHTGSEAWEVRIYNDGKNTREFVARCLCQIVGHSENTAYQTMMQAHQNGIAVVGRYVYEVAEMYYGELKKNGIVCDLVPVEEDK
jgi:ATP-dependent Clp protease adapter protein ClpS